MLLQSSNGYVGIGTTSPSSLLHISSGNNTTAIIEGSGTNAYTEIRSASGDESAVRFSTTSSARWLLGKGNSTENGSNAGSDFFLNRYNDAGAFQSQPIVVKRNTGYVGINQGGPTAPLDVKGSGSQTASFDAQYIENFATSSTSSVNKAGLEIQSTGSWTGTSANNIGLYVSSVTGGTNNYDAIFNGGGNVGIGTSTPTVKLQVSGTIKTDSLQSGNLRMSNGATNGYVLQSDAAGNGKWVTPSSVFSSYWATGTNVNGNLTLYPTATNYYLGVGTTAPLYPADFTASLNGSGQYVERIYNSGNSTGNSNYGLLIEAGSTTYISARQSQLIGFELPDGNQIGAVSQTSSSGISYLTSSDYRLKRNIAETHYGIADLMKIQVKDYVYNTDKDDNQQTGYLAQQLFTVFPQAVHQGGADEKTDPWMVDYGKVTPLIVKSVQDQQSIIEMQNKKIEELEKQLNELKSLIKK